MSSELDSFMQSLKSTRHGDGIAYMSNIAAECSCRWDIGRICDRDEKDVMSAEVRSAGQCAV